MAIWILDQYTGPELDYPTLGFRADPNELLSATAAPDARWSLHSNQAAAETVTRYTLGVDPSYIEPTDGHLLTYSDAENRYKPTAPGTFLAAPASDAAIAGRIDDPASATRASLSATIVETGDVRYPKLRADRAPKQNAPLLVQTPLTVTAITNAIYGYNPDSGLYYGTDLANGHYITSPDAVTWTDRTYSPSTYTPYLIGWGFDSTYMYAYSSTGRIWRASLNVFNAWTEITVPGLHAVTTGRPGVLAVPAPGVLVYGNYTSGFGNGAYLFRSTDAGATWTQVLGLPDTKHVHCVRKSTNTGYLWATVGDGGNPAIGLYRSTDNGATWTYMSSNDYGIDMVFVPEYGDRPAMVVLEGDGYNRPLIMGFPEDGEAGDKTIPLVWFTGAPSDPLSTRATTRGIGLTAAGDLVFFTTIEGGGVVGTRSGIWVAQGPDFTRSVLLKETTGAEPVAYSQTFVIGNTTYNYQWSFTTPTFGSY